MPPLPLADELVPATTAPADAPPGFALVEESLALGLPHAIALDAAWSLVVTLPTGLARSWREADPRAVVTTSDEEDEPAPFADDRPRDAARLVLRRADGRVAGAMPMSGVGVPRRIGDRAEEPAARLEVLLLAWDIRAGNVVGPGDWGGRIRLAWRRADRATPFYTPPALNPYVLPRVPKRRESLVLRAAPRFEVVRIQAAWRLRRVSLLRAAVRIQP